MLRPIDPKLVEYLQTRDVTCPGCKYNLRGLAKPSCPECGYRIDLPHLMELDTTQPRRPLYPFWWRVRYGMVGWWVAACIVAITTCIQLFGDRGPTTLRFLGAGGFVSSLGFLACGLVLVAWRKRWNAADNWPRFEIVACMAWATVGLNLAVCLVLLL